MYPFEFSMPTNAIFGEGAVARVGSVAAGFGKKALLLTYDEGLVKKLGFYQKVAESCEAAGVELVHLLWCQEQPDR